MKLKLPRSFVVLTAAVLLALPAAASVGTALQMQLGNPSNATGDTNNHAHYLLQKTVESLDFADYLGEPNWAAWDLTGSDIGGSGRNSSFYTDTNLPSNFYRVTYDDYTHSGYDRGHLCPSADRTDTTNNNKLVFYMSNIMPQTGDNNQGVWENFESYCQGLASSGYELLIQCGPSSFSGAKINTNGPVYIPGYTWKIAVVVPAGAGSALSRVSNDTRVITIKVPNITGIRTTPWTNFVTNVTVLETDTSNVFFTAVAADVAEVLKAKVDGKPAPTLTSFSPTNGSVGASVTITGSNFTGASKVKFNGTNASFTVNSSTSISATVPTGAGTGKISVIAPGGLVTSASNFTVNNNITNILISQVYGGGGNSGANYKNDFIELYNAGNVTVDLSTWAVQYTSATGTTWSETILNGTVAPGHYYLIQEAAGAGGTNNLPTPQATGSIAMSATAGKVALTKTTVLLSGGNPVGGANVADFIGFGTTADAYEGSGPAPAPSNTNSDQRAGSGATDTNNNASDFSAAAANPRNN